MAQKQFLPFLTDDQGRSLVKENGVVVTRPIPEWMEESPDRWEESAIQYGRDEEFKGVIKSYITNLKFLSDGAFIIRDWFYRFGIDVVMFFIWLKLDQNFGGNLVHRSWYKGEVDFTTIKDEYDGVEINIAEGGFHKQLTNNKTVPYSFAFNDPETVSLEMDGMDIFYQAKFLINDGFDAGDPNFQFRNHLIDLATISNEFERIGSVGPVSRTKVTNSNTAIRATNKHFLEATTNGTVNVKYKFQVNNTFFPPPAINPAATWRIVIRKIDASNIGSNAHVLISRGPAQMQGTFNLEGQVDIPILTGERLYLYNFMDVEGATGDAQMRWIYTGAEDNIFEVNFKFKKELTVIPAFTAYELGNKLTQSVSDGASTLDGDFLKNDVNLLISSGDGIRGIQTSGCKTTFSDWYKSIDAVKCVGMEIITNNPNISSRYDKFVQTSTIASLGECRNFRLEVAKNLLYGSVQAGYPSSDLDEVNGRYAFANPYYWKSPIVNSSLVYDCQSVYKADPFLIEITRGNLEGKNTTDSQFDNNLFFLDAEKVFANNYTGDIVFTAGQQIKLTNILGLALKRNTRFKVLNGINQGTYSVLQAVEVGADTVIQVNENVVDEAINTSIEWRHYRLRRKVYTITGIPNGDSVFNIELTAKRNLANHYRWLRSSFDKCDNKFLVLTSTEKNAELKTDDGAGNIVMEKEKVLVGSMGDKVFYPYLFNIEVESPYNLRDLITSNSTGKFDFTFLEVTYSGYPMEIKTNDATLETQEYALLATAGNNLLNLTKGR